MATAAAAADDNDKEKDEKKQGACSCSDDDKQRVVAISVSDRLCCEIITFCCVEDCLVDLSNRIHTDHVHSSSSQS